MTPSTGAPIPTSEPTLAAELSSLAATLPLNATIAGTPSKSEPFPSAASLRSLISFLPLSLKDYRDSPPSFLLSRSPATLLRSFLRARGPVAPGFGRGSKQLGFPTANLPKSLFEGEALAGVKPGVYIGWGLIEGASDGVGRADRESYEPPPGRRGRRIQHKVVANVGRSPTFEEGNPELIIEAHFIRPKGGGIDEEIEGSFYNE
ncbi:hypothetical protein TeGR_g5614 [Tetraparma gracilis]|uniref:riboflavin kinase n=1 Tax=Tetraparma gracilis TaxID=2962635 RepID=A0ABQ6MFN7_9STRA|nr:hypothetical protein TeGR_g5614 [Tetraparma gracilis]